MDRRRFFRRTTFLDLRNPAILKKPFSCSQQTYECLRSQGDRLYKRRWTNYDRLRIRVWIYFQSWGLWSPNLIYKEIPSFKVPRFGEFFQKLAIFRSFSYREGATRQSFYSFISVVKVLPKQITWNSYKGFLRVFLLFIVSKVKNYVALTSF